MDMTGTRKIAADRATVWSRLNDPVLLQAAIPGCTELTGSADTGFAATVVQKVGPVKATFRGTVQLADVRAPDSYAIVGEGKGGIAGFAKGRADVTLTEVPGGTELSYRADVQVGGKLAQLGNRIIGGYANQMADAFFDRFAKAIESQPAD
jgi:uncharacterized protein